MHSKTYLIAAALAVVEARFGQENLAQAAIAALGGGEAATFAGQSIGTLLAGASPCAKLQLADDILEALGEEANVVAAALGLVAAERNFNDFVLATGDICAEASLPANPLLRGVVPLWDPEVTGSDTENANSALSIQTPFENDGLSVAEIAIAQGFTNFTAKALDGSEVALAGLGAAGAGADAGADAAADDDADVAAAVVACNGAAANNAANNAADDAEADDAAADEEEEDDDAGAAAGAGAAGADFGSCNPTLIREGGLGGRPADEFTFQSADAGIAGIQQEALNPLIIINRISDELTNQCGANDAAKALLDEAEAAVVALGGAPNDRSDDTVTLFNGILGF